MEKSDRKVKYLAKNTLLFTISNFGSKILSFLLVPFFTYFLSTEDYGIADLITTIVTLCIFVFSLNISSATLRFAMDKESNKDGILKYSLLIHFAGFLIFLPIVIIVAAIKVINWPSYAFIYLVFIYFFACLYEILSCYTKGIEKVIHVSISGIILTITTLVLDIITIVGFGLRLDGYLISMLAGYVIGSLYLLIMTRPKIFKTRLCDVETRKKMIKYAIPLIFNGIAWWMNAALDKFFITSMYGVEYNGLYAAASKLPAILSVFATIFNQAWLLSAIKEYGSDNDNSNFFSELYILLNFFLVLMTSFLMVFNNEIGAILFSNEFYDAKQYTPFLLVAGIFSALSGFVGCIFSAKKDGKMFAVSTVVAAILNVILNFILLRTIGVIGACIATAISFFVIWIIRVITVKKYLVIYNNWFRDAITYILICTQATMEYIFPLNYILKFSFFVIIIIINFDRFFILINYVIKLFRKKHCVSSDVGEGDKIDGQN